MAAHAAVGVHDDLAAREARVSHGTADDEASGGVHVDLGVVGQLHALGRQHRLHDVLDERGLERGVLHVVGVLRGHDHLLHARRAAVHVAHGNLRLAVGAQIRHGAVLAYRGQSLGQAVRQVDGQGQERLRLVAGVAEHHALVARAHGVVRVVAGASVLGLPRRVDAERDVRALLVDGVDDAAGLAVEAVLRAVVADVAQHLAHDAGHVHVRLRADLAGHEHHARGGQRLARAAHLRRVGRLAVRRDVAGGSQLGLLRQDGVEHRIGYLVAHLVRMAFRHGFGREDVRRFNLSHELLLHRCRLYHLGTAGQVGAGIIEPTLSPDSR